MQQKRTSPWKWVSVTLFIMGLGVINVFPGTAAFVLGIILMASSIVLLVLKGWR